ncbi:hypothetical protein HDU85_007263 [Gaertneriomyces sp. JEL0708]|nr:hypothetical protein HDU85_007263 [Gaertneriomyces sp. JEL0708]
MSSSPTFVLVAFLVYKDDNGPAAVPFVSHAILPADTTIRDAKTKLLIQLNARDTHVVASFRKLRKDVLLPGDTREFAALDVFCQEASEEVPEVPSSLTGPSSSGDVPLIRPNRISSLGVAFANITPNRIGSLGVAFANITPNSPEALSNAVAFTVPDPTAEQVKLGDVWRACDSLAEYEGVINSILVLERQSPSQSLASDYATMMARTVSWTTPPPYTYEDHDSSENSHHPLAGAHSDAGMSTSLRRESLSTTIIQPSEETGKHMSSSAIAIEITDNRTPPKQHPLPFYKRKKALLYVIAIVGLILVGAITGTVIATRKKDSSDDDISPPLGDQPLPGQSFFFGPILKSYDMANKAFLSNLPDPTIELYSGFIYVPTVGGYRALNMSSSSTEFSNRAPIFTTSTNCTTPNRLTKSLFDNTTWTMVCMNTEAGGSVTVYNVTDPWWTNGGEAPMQYGLGGTHVAFSSIIPGVSGSFFATARVYSAENYTVPWTNEVYQFMWGTFSGFRGDIPATRMAMPTVGSGAGKLLYVVGADWNRVIVFDVEHTPPKFSKASAPVERCLGESGRNVKEQFPNVYVANHANQVVLMCYADASIVLRTYDPAQLNLLKTVQLDDTNRDSLGSVSPIVLRTGPVVLTLTESKTDVKAWDIMTGKLLATYNVNDVVYSWKLDVDERHLVIVTKARIVQVVAVALRR